MRWQITGVSPANSGDSETATATHRYPVLLDEIQNRTQQGPSLPAAVLHGTVRVDDLADDDQWPASRDEVLAQTPVRSIVSIPMFREGATAARICFDVRYAAM